MTINDRLTLIDTLATRLVHPASDTNVRDLAARIRTATAHVEHDLRQIEIRLRGILTAINRP